MSSKEEPRQQGLSEYVQRLSEANEDVTAKIMAAIQLDSEVLTADMLKKKAALEQDYMDKTKTPRRTHTTFEAERWLCTAVKQAIFDKMYILTAGGSLHYDISEGQLPGLPKLRRALSEGGFRYSDGIDPSGTCATIRIWIADAGL